VHPLQGAQLQLKSPLPAVHPRQVAYQAHPPVPQVVCQGQAPLPLALPPHRLGESQCCFHQRCTGGTVAALDVRAGGCPHDAFQGHSQGRSRGGSRVNATCLEVKAPVAATGAAVAPSQEQPGASVGWDPLAHLPLPLPLPLPLLQQCRRHRPRPQLLPLAHHRQWGSRGTRGTAWGAGRGRGRGRGSSPRPAAGAGSGARLSGGSRGAGSGGSGGQSAMGFFQAFGDASRALAAAPPLRPVQASGVPGQGRGVQAAAGSAGSARGSGGSAKQVDTGTSALTAVPSRERTFSGAKAANLEGEDSMWSRSPCPSSYTR